MRILNAADTIRIELEIEECRYIACALAFYKLVIKSSQNIPKAERKRRLKDVSDMCVLFDLLF